MRTTLASDHRTVTNTTHHHTESRMTWLAEWAQTEVYGEGIRQGVLHAVKLVP